MIIHIPFVFSSYTYDDQNQNMMIIFLLFFLVILFLTSYATAREALHVAFNESMVNGEYMFIVCMKDVGEVKRKLKHQFKWFISHYTETLHTTRDVQKALEATLILAPKLPEAEYSRFVDRLRTAMGKAPFFSNTYIGKINGTHMDKSKSQVMLYSITNNHGN